MFLTTAFLHHVFGVISVMKSFRFGFSERPYGCGDCLRAFSTEEETVCHYVTTCYLKDQAPCESDLWTTQMFEELSDGRYQSEITTQISLCTLAKLISWAENKCNAEGECNSQLSPELVVRSVLSKATEMYNSYLEKTYPDVPGYRFILKAPMPRLSALKDAARLAKTRRKCCYKASCIYASQRVASARRTRIYRSTDDRFCDVERLSGRLRRRVDRSGDEGCRSAQTLSNLLAKRRRRNLIRSFTESKDLLADIIFPSNIQKTTVDGDMTDCVNGVDQAMANMFELGEQSAFTVLDDEELIPSKDANNALDPSAIKMAVALEVTVARRLADRIRMKRKRENSEYRIAERLVDRLKARQKRAQIRGLAVAEDDTIDPSLLTIASVRSLLAPSTAESSAANGDSKETDDVANDKVVEETNEESFCSEANGSENDAISQVLTTSKRIQGNANSADICAANADVTEQLAEEDLMDMEKLVCRRLIDRHQKRTLRSDPAFRMKQNERERERKKILREDPEFRLRQNLKNRERMKKLREDPAFRMREISLGRMRKNRVQVEHEEHMS